MHNLLNKNTTIMIVEPVSSIRNTIRKVLSEAGYEDILMASTPKEAFTLMFSNRVDWIFCGLFPTENVTGVHLLRAAVEIPEYRHLRFSVLINDEDLRHLPFLYSLGLFSYHLKPMTYDSLLRDINSLTEQLESVDEEHQFAAASLRRFLEQQKNSAVITKLEAGLFETVDKSPEQLSRYISSLFKGGNKLKGMTMLYSYWNKDQETNRLLEPIMIEHVGVSNLGAVEVDSLVRTCMVVDPDDTSSLQVKNVLTAMGVHDVVQVSAVSEACEILPKDRILIL